MAGAKVEQGRADHMTKGDWLLVPSGTPHWHTEFPSLSVFTAIYW